MPELRTAKTLGYYINSHRTNRLEVTYGSYLENMDINDRNGLMLCLASFIYINDIPIFEGKLFYDCAAIAISEDLDFTGDDFGDILETLEGITVPEARDLLHALSS
jgi:hypothetical protein